MRSILTADGSRAAAAVAVTRGRVQERRDLARDLASERSPAAADPWGLTGGVPRGNEPRVGVERRASCASITMLNAL